MEVNDTPIAQSHLELEKRIRNRAHEIWQARQGHDGRDTSLDDWLQAEREVLGAGGESAQNRGSVVGPAGPTEGVEELGES